MAEVARPAQEAAGAHTLVMPTPPRWHACTRTRKRAGRLPRTHMHPHTHENTRAELPLHVQDCEEDVGEAFDAYAKAGHAASVAKRKAERLGMQLRWMRQEEGLLRQTQTTQI